MRDMPDDDRPGFVAEKPEYCFACCRLIGMDRHTASQSSSKCSARTAPFTQGVIRVREDLAVEVRGDPVLVQSGKAEVAVAAGECICAVGRRLEGSRV